MLKRIIGLFSLTLFLTGCLPAVAFVAGASAGGAIIYDKRSSKIMYQDRTATDTAQSMINADPILANKSHISIATFNHIMIIVGQADSEALRQRAYRIVSRVEHVRRIYNQIEIANPISISERSQDTWITSKVKTYMVTTPGLHSSQVKVVTENRVVYLMGLVTPKQSELAADAARHIEGVRKVVKVFEYQH